MPAMQRMRKKALACMRFECAALLGRGSPRGGRMWSARSNHSQRYGCILTGHRCSPSLAHSVCHCAGCLRSSDLDRNACFVRFRLRCGAGAGDSEHCFCLRFVRCFVCGHGCGLLIDKHCAQSGQMMRDESLSSRVALRASSAERELRITLPAALLCRSCVASQAMMPVQCDAGDVPFAFLVRFSRAVAAAAGAASALFAAAAASVGASAAPALLIGCGVGSAVDGDGRGDALCCSLLCGARGGGAEGMREEQAQRTAEKKMDDENGENSGPDEQEGSEFGIDSINRCNVVEEQRQRHFICGSSLVDAQVCNSQRQFKEHDILKQRAISGTQRYAELSRLIMKTGRAQVEKGATKSSLL